MEALAALARWAATRPNGVAVMAGARRTIWQELEARVLSYAEGLTLGGIGPGDRVAVLVPPGADLLAIVYACLRIGAVAVLADPGLGIRRLGRLLGGSGAVAFIGVPLAYLARCAAQITGLRLRACTVAWPGCVPLSAWRARRPRSTLLPAVPDDAPGLVLYTSGATGDPKGITVSRSTLDAQARALCQLTALGPEDVLLAILPAMLLIGPFAGCTVRIPGRRRDLDRDLAGSSHSFGSPAVWGPLADRLERRGLRLPELRCLLFGGCAIDPELIRRWRGLAPRAMLASVYGATEGVPVCWATADELLALDGEGTLIGRPGDGAALRLEPMGLAGAAGKLLVRGPVMAGEGWIDLGDLARQDGTGRWWFLGRASERVECAGKIWTTVPVERAFQHPLVRRVALVGIGARPAQTPVLVIEPCRWPWTRRGAQQVVQAVIGAAGGLAVELGLTPERVLLRRRLPVDARHRAKILRHELARWAARRLGAAR